MRRATPGRARGQSNRGRGRGRVSGAGQRQQSERCTAPVQTISDSDSESKSQSPAVCESESDESLPCQESDEEIPETTAAAAVEAVEMPPPPPVRPKRGPAIRMPRDLPAGASFTSMWDSSTVWAHNIAVVRRTDTPVSCYNADALCCCKTVLLPRL